MRPFRQTVPRTRRLILHGLACGLGLLGAACKLYDEELLLAPDADVAVDASAASDATIDGDGATPICPPDASLDPSDGSLATDADTDTDTDTAADADVIQTACP